MGLPERYRGVLVILCLLCAGSLKLYFSSHKLLHGELPADPAQRRLAEVERVSAAPGHWLTLVWITGSIIALAFIWPPAFEAIVGTVIEIFVWAMTLYDRVRA